MAREAADIVLLETRLDSNGIRRFMLIIGPLSSIFDFPTFAVLLKGFGCGETAFQTGWFVESLVTQVLVLFIIRTRGRAWSNRPSMPLTVTAIVVVIIGATLPYTGLGARLGMAPLPGSVFVFLVAVVTTYLGLVEIIKEKLMSRLLPDGKAGATGVAATT